MRNNAVNSLGMLGPYVVGPDLGSNYTTIQSAITAAASLATNTAPLNVYIKPGVYVENLTLASNVILIGLGGSISLTPVNFVAFSVNMAVQVQGHHSCSVTNLSILSLDSIQFVNNNSSNPLFSFTGAGLNAEFILKNCRIQDGNIAQNLFQYDDTLAGSSEFYDCTFYQTSTSFLYGFTPGATANMSIAFNNCNLHCNPITVGHTGGIFVTMNGCNFIAVNQDLIDGSAGDDSSYIFNDCTLIGDIINVITQASYTFNNCIWTAFSFTGTASVGAVITIVNCQVSGSDPIYSSGTLPGLTTFPVGTIVLIENCFWTAHIFDGVARRVLVNKTNPFGTASEAFTGMFTYEVQVAQTSVSNTPLALFVIPMVTESSNLINIAITGNIPPASTCSGFIRSAYGLFAAYGANPLQNFLIDETGGFGPDGAAVSLVPGAGTITIQVVANAPLGTNHYWAATITWTNVFTNA